MTKISQLPPAGALTGVESVPVVQSGVTVRAPLNALVGPMGPTGPIGPPGDATLLSASPITATGGTTSRALADRFADMPNLKNWGAVGDGTTDDTAAVTAAEASAVQTIYVPEGTYATSLSQSALHKRYVGPGQIKTQTSKRGPYYSDVTAPPSATSTHTSVTNAFDGDWSNSQFAVEHRITGATTLGQPTTSYTYLPEAYPHYTYLYNTSGYNHETDGNTGRTGACAYRVKLFQAGQGDLAAFNASAFVTGTKAGSTHFLANPAVALFNGDLEAGADGTYLNAGEMILDDNGFDVAGIGWVINMNRSNATAAKFAMWCGHRVQSVGTQFVNAAISVYGKVTTGLDFVTCEGVQALVMKAGQRVYGNGANSDSASGTASATSPGTSWLGYDATLAGWETVVGGTRRLGVNASGITVTGSVTASGTVSGSVTATGTTTARTLADRFADAVSVKDFGAVGDGVADDKAEIQAAIDAVSTAGGGVVFVPEGTYTMSLRVTVKAGVTLAGAGIGATTLKVTDHDRVVVLEADSGIRNISLDANGQHDAVVNKLSVLSVSGDNCVIDTVEVIDGYSGISVGGADEATAPSNTEITNVYTHDNVSRGLILDPFANGTIVNGIHSWGNGNAGILIGHGAFNNLVTNFVLEDINNASLWLHEGAHDNVVCNGVIKNPALTTSVGVNFSSGAYNNRVSNVHISGYARAVQFVGEFIDGVYPAILDHDTSGNEIDGIVGYGNDNTNVNSYAVTFQQTSGSSPIAIDNVVRNCSFTNYYGVFRNVSDAANGCQIANIKTASVGAGGVFKGMKSTAGDVVRVSNVQGFVTRAKYQTATFSIASTGTKTPAAISHGLPYTPPLANCSASLLRDPTNGLVADFRLDHLWVVASTSTDLTARAQVGSASATGTAVQAMIVTVDMCAEDGFNCSLLT